MTSAFSGSLVVVALAWLLVGVSAGRPAAQTGAAPLFQRGLEALHQFEYEDANEAFRQARELDSGFLMAYWGEAMTYHQTLWRNENLEAARLTLARLGPTPSARRAKARNPKELGWLGAVEILFGDGDAETRRRNYANAMGQLHAREPDDPDAASLYALALLGTMSRSLIGYADMSTSNAETAEAAAKDQALRSLRAPRSTHEGHSQALAGSAIQAQVAEILEGVLRSHPEHPGALHYLLHNQDDPAHAHRALAAARTLARLAPESSHTRHMPAHIFFQLGLWQDAAGSDRAAFAASEAWVARKHLDASMRNYHALSWLQYELLQLGKYREAWATIDDLAPVVKASGQLALLSDLASMRARYVIETSGWPLMAAENNFGNANELFAIGMSAAYAGDAARAERARGGLAERARDPREGDLRPAIALMELEVQAAIAHAAGRGDEAVRVLQTAAEREGQLPPPLGLPAPIKPAPELLGELLVALGRPAEAVRFFEQALSRNPNRSLSVLGLARASAAVGNTGAAQQHYRALLSNFDHADADLPLVREARAALEPAATPASRLPLRAVVPGAIAVVALAGVVLVWRAKRTSRRGPERTARHTTNKKGPVSRTTQKTASKRRR